MGDRYSMKTAKLFIDENDDAIILRYKRHNGTVFVPERNYAYYNINNALLNLRAEGIKHLIINRLYTATRFMDMVSEDSNISEMRVIYYGEKVLGYIIGEYRLIPENQLKLNEEISDGTERKTIFERHLIY